MKKHTHWYFELNPSNYSRITTNYDLIHESYKMAVLRMAMLIKAIGFVEKDDVLFKGCRDCMGNCISINT